MAVAAKPAPELIRGLRNTALLFILNPLPMLLPLKWPILPVRQPTPEVILALLKLPNLPILDRDILPDREEREDVSQPGNPVHGVEAPEIVV